MRGFVLCLALITVGVPPAARADDGDRAARASIGLVDTLLRAFTQGRALPHAAARGGDLNTNRARPVPVALGHANHHPAAPQRPRTGPHPIIAHVTL